MSYELGARKAVVSEIFGHITQVTNVRHYIYINYFINHVYNNFHHLVTDNLPWWFQCGLMERSAVAIDGKLGVRYGDHFSAFIEIVIVCVRIGREEAFKKMIQVPRGGLLTFKGYLMEIQSRFETSNRRQCSWFHYQSVRISSTLRP